MQTKTCSECNVTKRISLFYVDTRYPDGRMKRCTECHNEIRKQRYMYKVKNRAEDNTDVKLMTHGEMYVFRRDNINFKDDLSKIEKAISCLPPKMTRGETLEYYGNKIRNYFIRNYFNGSTEAFFDYFQTLKMRARDARKMQV